MMTYVLKGVLKNPKLELTDIELSTPESNASDVENL